ncbi:MAG: hypothetical protein QM488_01230 [Rhizobiaceae bacterium]
MRIILGLAALVLAATPALADQHTVDAIKTATTSAGDVLTNSKGMTLYVFDKDKPGVSNCKGKCIALWPSMPAEASSKNEGQFSVIKREDGSFQWAYKKMPLYTWVKDKKAGDVTGDGVKNVWHVAKP